MTQNGDEKFEEELTCGFENDIRNLANFHQSTLKCQNWDFDWILLSKVENSWAKNLRRIYVYWHWRMIKSLKKNWFWHKEFNKFWPEHSKVLQICTLMGSLWPKYAMFDLKKYRVVIVPEIEEWCKTWRKTDLRFRKWNEKFGEVLTEHLKVSKLGL